MVAPGEWSKTQLAHERLVTRMLPVVSRQLVRSVVVVFVVVVVFFFVVVVFILYYFCCFFKCFFGVMLLWL